MISNEKMEQYWQRYRNEGVAKGLSLQAFCSVNNIPYNAFEKYLKLRRHFSTVHPINITGKPSEEERQDDITGMLEEKAPIHHSNKELSVRTNDEAVRIRLDMRISNGIHIRQKNLDYEGLHRLVEKLEVLC